MSPWTWTCSFLRSGRGNDGAGLVRFYFEWTELKGFNIGKIADQSRECAEWRGYGVDKETDEGFTERGETSTKPFFANVLTIEQREAAEIV